MKLQSKRTGIIGYLQTDTDAKRLRVVNANNDTMVEYTSLAKLNAEWEDYEDVYFKFTPALLDNRFVALIVDEKATREEAKQAVEKLKAVKRLKDKGFRFIDNKIIGEYGNVSYRLNYPATAVEEKDLDLLFGGEE